jgi:lipoyl(octanoyl) transferase
MKGEGERGKGEEPNEERGTRIVQHSAFTVQHSRSNPQSPIPNPLIFRLLLDPPAAGDWNMAVDDALLETAIDQRQSTLRFYGWQEPTLSLGYFQTYADRWRHAASSRASVVRRVTGGGAIVHDRELTYSVTVPDGHPLAVGRLQLYRTIHAALIEALAQWGIEATLFEPSTAARSTDAEPFLCFQRRSPGDVLVGDTKIAGSAQRRSRGAVLQHGSVLLARSPAAPELCGLRELVDKTIEPAELVQAWMAKLADALAVDWQPGELGEHEYHRAAAIMAEKHGWQSWIEHRGRS